MDWDAELLAPIYASDLAVPAALRTRAGRAATVRAIDDTGASDVHDNVEIATVRPVAYVRARELASLRITAADLDGGMITLNGVAWRIETVGPRPSPSGERHGELQLRLMSDPRLRG